MLARRLLERVDARARRGVDVGDGQLPPLPAPGEPGPFSLSDPAVVEQLLAGAGFTSIEIVAQAEQIVTGADRVDMAVDAASRVGGVREALAANDDPAFHDEVRAAVRAALLERVHDDELRLGAAAFVVTAVRPADWRSHAQRHP